MLAVLGIFVLGAISSLGAPLSSSPDESNHIARAVSLDAGQLLGPQARGRQRAEITVTIPRTFAALAHTRKCFQLLVDVTPRCLPRLVDSPRLVHAKTYVGRYPPFYYAIVGIPSLFSSSPNVVYAMRLVSVALSALLLGLALALALCFGSGTALTGGVLIAITPQVLYESSVVQPSGLEISSAICVWVALLLLLWRREGQPVPGAVVSAAGASTVVLMLSRDISPFWCAAIGLVVLAGARRGALTELAGRRDVRAWSVVVGLATLFQVGWDLYAHPFWIYVRHHAAGSVAHLAWAALKQSPAWLTQMVSEFGYRTSLAPIATYVVVGAAVSAAVVLGLLRGTGRQRLSIGLAGVGTFLIPVAILVAAASADGETWSGRYTMPFAVGIPIAASGAIRLRRNLVTRFVDASAACWAVAVVTSLWAELRRFSVGDKGALNLLFTLHPTWQPPMTLPVLALASVIVTALMLGWVIVEVRGDLHHGGGRRTMTT
jgi:hypothetical protein